MHYHIDDHKAFFLPNKETMAQMGIHMRAVEKDVEHYNWEEMRNGTTCEGGQEQAFVRLPRSISAQAHKPLVAGWKYLPLHSIPNPPSHKRRRLQTAHILGLLRWQRPKVSPIHVPRQPLRRRSQCDENTTIRRSKTCRRGDVL